MTGLAGNGNLKEAANRTTNTTAHLDNKTGG